MGEDAKDDKKSAAAKRGAPVRKPVVEKAPAVKSVAEIGSDDSNVSSNDVLAYANNLNKSN